MPEVVIGAVCHEHAPPPKWGPGDGDCWREGTCVVVVKNIAYSVEHAMQLAVRVLSEVFRLLVHVTVAI